MQSANINYQSDLLKNETMLTVDKEQNKVEEKIPSSRKLKLTTKAIQTKRFKAAFGAFKSIGKVENFANEIRLSRNFTRKTEPF